MSENIIGGKLKLKGKPLPVISTIKKKKKEEGRRREANLFHKQPTARV